MPKINIQSAGLSNAGGINAQASPADFGAQEAQAITGLGSTITAIGGQQLAKEKKLEKERVSNEARTQIHSYRAAALANNATFKKDNPNADQKQREANFDLFTKDYTANNELNPVAKKSFDMNAVDMKSKVALDSINTDTIRSVNKQVDSISQTADTLINLVTTDPTQLADSIKEMQGVLSNPMLDENKARDMFTEFQHNATEAAFSTMLDREGDNYNPKQALADLSSGKFDKMLDPDKKIALIKDAGREIKAMNVLSKKDEAVTMAFEFVDLMAKKQDGTLSEMEISAFRDKYKDKKEAAVKWLRLIQRPKPTEAESKLANNLSIVDNAFLGNGILDPTDNGIRKAVGVHYSLLLEKMSGLQPEEKHRLSMAYVKQVGVVPPQMIQDINSGMNSNKADKRLESATLLNDIYANLPTARNQMSGKNIGDAQELISYQQSGFTPSEALALQDSKRETPKAMLDARKSAFATIKKESEPKYFIEDKLNEGFFTFGISASPEMVSEFTRIAEEEYIAKGNKDIAYESAYKIMQKSWGNSTVGNNNGQVKYAPEILYGVEGMSQEENAAWMNHQLNKDVRDNSIVSDSSTLSLAPHPRITIDGKPAYMVFIQNGNTGEFNTVSDKEGNPMAWVPSFTDSDEGKKLLIEKQKSDAEIKKNAKEMRASKVGIKKDNINTGGRNAISK